MPACLLMGRLGIDLLCILIHNISHSFIGLACASCMQGLSGFPQMRLQASTIACALMDEPC